MLRSDHRPGRVDDVPRRLLRVTEALEPLLGLRLETPRLVLRLPDADEIAALASVAEAGIHPPETMPFAVAWTDAIGTPAFRFDSAAHHAEKRALWSEGDWTLLLAVFLAGAPIGIQDLRGGRVARGATVDTGSWLGRSFQGKGYGTEMRAAVLELAFVGLGAQAATSGWLAGSDASRRVSEKLGYEEVGTALASPRGTPVVEHLMRLERDRWRCPVPVEIIGLEPCRHLFGVAGG
jgi:RimJ/RimL family protein N-acetyltransferase